MRSGEEAAQQLKQLNPDTLGRMWTRDFTSMYTSLPQTTIVAKVMTACHEAFLWVAADKEKCPLERIGVSIDYDYKMRATATLNSEGAHDLTDIKALLECVVQGTLIQQGEGTEILRQKQGIPMGGKASSEIANLYCYAVESKMVDETIANYGLPAARRYQTTMRFIDDMQGFGEMNWNALQYEMDHKETTQPDGTIIFLGMKVTKKEKQLLLEQQPKGVGWMWKPQKYVEATSTHTHYTKRRMFFWFVREGRAYYEYKKGLQRSGHLPRRRTSFARV